MELTDSQLIENSLSGDNTAFEMLVTRHISRIYNFIYRLTGEAEVAQDITQDTFVKVWKNLRKYNERFAFNTWIISIARNTTIDWLRKKRSYVFSDFNKEEGDSFEDSLADIEALPDEIFERKEIEKTLQEALTHISIEQKTILLMHLSEGLTFEDISDIIKKPMNTVKSTYRRGILKLRLYLQNAPK